MIKAIIFDMDGVLVDTEKFHERAYKKVTKDLGINITQKHIMSIKGVTAFEIFKYIFEKYKIRKDPKKYAMIKDRVYRSYLRNLKAMPGAVGLLRKLKRQKVKLAIASSGSKLNVEYILNKINAKNYFDVIVHGEDVRKGKPNPEIFFKAAKKLEVKPKECIVIEDAVNGIKAAKKAGMFCIGITTTFSKRKLKGADLVVDDLSGLKM